MSNEAKQFLESAKEAQAEKSMGAIEAAAEGMKAFLSGAREVGGAIWDAGKPAFDHGRTELAAALFHDADAHVMYMRGTQGVEQGQDQAPEHGLSASEAVKPPEVQKEQDRGLGM
jgi:hypothetical protein